MTLLTRPRIALLALAAALPLAAAPAMAQNTGTQNTGPQSGGDGSGPPGGRGTALPPPDLVNPPKFDTQPAPGAPRQPSATAPAGQGQTSAPTTAPATPPPGTPAR